MKVFEYSGVGGRKVNQDFLTYATMDERHAVFIVADGMGGYSHGEIAAQVAAEAVRDFVEEHYQTLEPEHLLREAIYFANESVGIKRFAINVKQMGTVIVVAYICENTAWLAWVGDSRIYIMRDGKPIYQTEDHSLINELRQVNTLKAADLERYSAIVTRSLMGENANSEPDIKSVEVQEGDVLWLCSDGVHKELPIYWMPDDDIELKTFLDGQNKHLSDNYTLIKVTL
jgi:serine/threonine protein phosphatase PrpC